MSEGAGSFYTVCMRELVLFIPYFSYENARSTVAFFFSILFFLADFFVELINSLGLAHFVFRFSFFVGVCFVFYFVFVQFY